MWDSKRKRIGIRKYEYTAQKRIGEKVWDLETDLRRALSPEREDMS